MFAAPFHERNFDLTKVLCFEYEGGKGSKGSLMAAVRRGTRSKRVVPPPRFRGGVGTGRGDPVVLRAWMQDVYARVNEAMIDEMLENFRWVK